ncbi:MAG TPA: TlpA disulfide reductase family protein [Bacteroidota bacterium]|nr:TlpA disulfide reductase family protein [Bacteroidota bacterium]
MKQSIIVFILLVLGYVSSVAQTDQKQLAPNFSLKKEDGTTIELAKLKGKVVIVNFWATWCPPCRAEIPDFIKVQEQYKKNGLVIVGISLDQNGWPAVHAFAAKAKFNYPIVLGNDEVVQAYGGIDAIPTSFIIDKKGYIVDKQVGMLTNETLEPKLKSLLK